jgi:hypothetical protein
MAATLLLLGVFLGASHAEPLYLQPAFVKLKLKKKEQARDSSNAMGALR